MNCSPNKYICNIVVQIREKVNSICTLTVLNETLFQKLNIRTKYVQFLS